MKIIITGSHFTPAQAVIGELREITDPEIIYIGRNTTREGDKSQSIESKILPKMKVKFIPLIAGRLQRVFTVFTIPSLLKVPIGFIQSFYLMMIYQPDVVLSFGGYVSVPVVISAWLWGIPVITHEQTLVTGLANKINSFFATKVAVSFREQVKPDKNMIFTGNPMRKEILNPISNDAEFNKFIHEAKKNKFPIIIVTGGNQGSHIINKTVIESLPILIKNAYLIHQTGDSKFNDFKEAQNVKTGLINPGRYLVRKWINGDDFGYILEKADLVLGRAGINTLLECAYFGIPVLTVPIPYLYKNEQNVNACFFESIGLAKVISQKDFSVKRLTDDIRNMIANIDNLKEKAKISKVVVVKDAAKILALETILLARE